MIEAAKLAKEYGSGDIRISYDQNIFIVGIKKESIEAFESSEFVAKHAQFGNIYFNNMIACAGTKTCSFGVIPNKPDAIEMAFFLNKEVPIEHGNVRMNWSACPKGCGVHGIADIGFEGCKAKDDAGNRVDGVHLFLGGKITKEPKEAKVLHKSLPITEAKHHVKYLLKAYAKFKRRAESFEEFDDRYLSANYTVAALSFMTKINYILNEKLGLNVELELDIEPKTHKIERFEIMHFGMKLFKLLTNESRFQAVDDTFEPILTQPKKIKEDEVSKINPKVPVKLSSVIYKMTHPDRSKRAAVFTEVLAELKGI